MTRDDWDAIQQELDHLDEIEGRVKSISSMFERTCRSVPKALPKDLTKREWVLRQRDAAFGQAECLRRYDDTRIKARRQIAELLGSFRLDAHGNVEPIGILFSEINTSERGDYPVRSGEVLDNREGDDDDE